MVISFFGGREDEDKRRQKEWSNLSFSKSDLFGHILKRSAHSLFGAWSFLLIHIRFTPSEGPKGFVICLFFLKEIRPWKLDHEKRQPSPMVRLHCPWCKPALITRKTTYYFAYDIPFHTHLQVVHNNMSFGLEFQSLQRVSNMLVKSRLNTYLYTHTHTYFIFV